MSKSVQSMRLDTGVSIRQRVGAHFSKAKTNDEDAKRLLDDLLLLPPHPDWAGDLTNWKEDPFQDRNWRFQRNSLRWLTPLVFMAEDGNEDAAVRWWNIVESWIDQNQAKPSRAKEPWYNMAVGQRAIALSLGASIVPEGSLDKYICELERHLDWLVDPQNLATQNHALHQHQGLFVLASLLRNKDAQDLAVQRMTELFVDAFDSEGLNDEGSTHYQKLNITWWKHAWRRVTSEQAPLPKDVSLRLRQAEVVLARMLGANRELVQVGDGAITEVSSGFSVATDWVISAGSSGEPIQHTSAVLTGGFAFSRGRWAKDAPSLTIRHGNPRSQGHGHFDQGAIWYSSGNTNWIVDSGFWSYERNDSIVDYLKSPLAHNIAYITNVEPDLSRPVDLQRNRITPKFDDFILRDRRFPEHDLRRRVVFIKELGIVMVIDSAKNLSEDQCLSQRLHLAPNLSTSPRENGLTLRSSQSRLDLQWHTELTNLRVECALQKNAQNWSYPKWKTRVPGHTVVSANRQSSPFSVFTINPKCSRVDQIVLLDGSNRGWLQFELIGSNIRQRISISGSVELDDLVE